MCNRKIRNESRISKNSVWPRVRFHLRPTAIASFESYSLSTQPSKPNNLQALVMNKAATYANKLPLPFSKGGAKYN